jgi:hypothetical protein
MSVMLARLRNARSGKTPLTYAHCEGVGQQMFVEYDSHAHTRGL